jgi:hypothetical protein
MFAQMAAVELMFPLQRRGASEVDDEVWLARQVKGPNHYRRRLM